MSARSTLVLLAGAAFVAGCGGDARPARPTHGEEATLSALTPASDRRPPIDRRAPSRVEIATFALG